MDTGEREMTDRMSDPIPHDTPARRDLRHTLANFSNRESGYAMSLAGSTDEEDAAALAHWLDLTLRAPVPLGADRRHVFRAASAEIHEALRARGLSVSSRGKVIRIVDDAERERRLAAVTEAAPCNERAAWTALEATQDQIEERDRLRLAAGPDPDARHEDHERGGR